MIPVFKFAVSTRIGSFVGQTTHDCSHASFDLDSQVNSTPVMGVGALFPVGNREFLLEGGLLHISNGGTKKPNRGQNQFILTLGVRF
jgi:hypothetical protein